MEEFDASYEFETLLKKNPHSTQLLVEDQGARYEHYEGIGALKMLKTSLEMGCLLCSILYFSLDAMRHSTFGFSWENPAMPTRLPTESGITLHSFNRSHFIVRDSERWSLVRFEEGNLLNNKG